MKKESPVTGGMGSLPDVEDQIYEATELPLNLAISTGEVTVFSRGADATNPEGEFEGPLYVWKSNTPQEGSEEQ